MEQQKPQYPSCNRDGELGLAKDIIDYLFLNHEHPNMEGAPVVGSMDLETYLKERYPEIKEYYYGKDDLPTGDCTI